MKKLDQHGTGIIVLLFTLLVLGVIGFVGWNLWQKHQKAVTSTPTSTVDNVDPYYNKTLKQYTDCLQKGGHQLSTIPVCSSDKGDGFKPLPDKARALRYVTVTEWDIRVPYRGSQDITYTVKDNTAELSSKQLNALGVCSSAGELRKYAPQDEVMSEAGFSLGVAKDVFANRAYTPYFSHVGNNYYMYVSPQMLCGTSKGDYNDYLNEATSQLLVDTFTSFAPKWQAVPAP